MSILKALEKRKIEGPAKTPQEDEVKPKAKKQANVVQFEQNRQNVEELPEMFKDREFKIGKPSSASNEQSTSLIGTALPGLEIQDTAGATLDAVGSARPAAKRLPEFARWEVEAERVEPRLVSITQPHSSYCEEYRSLRTHVLHKSQRQKLQSIVVASVNPSEGKSVTALNLSWMLAQTDGVKALVIDADLRMPSLTDYLGIETDKGLSDVLADTTSLTDSIVTLEPSGLHLLPGGEARSDVAELISGPKFREILRQARELFDFVIIDAPPLGIFTDAAVLINHADGAMLVVRAGRTKYRTVDRVMDTLPKNRMLGVVLNQSEEVMNESQYGYGYYQNQRLGY
ncbi:MAG: CpsD/CapB family tyrosine-protein kinase [Pyrinomonadaceae bacterium]|nr:CpsD/CapB family tyrosine-protein kinase [Pyrinomonadaceae bacterium]